MKRTIYLLFGICLIFAVTAGILLFVPERAVQPPFVPPEFDSDAIDGIPSVSEELGWREVYKQGMSFKASVCGEIIIQERTAKIYFTNHAENTLWLKVRIFNQNGEILGETGLIKPDQYVEDIIFDKLPEDNEKIILKLMSYQPETYYSGGSVTLNTVAKIQGD